MLRRSAFLCLILFICQLPNRQLWGQVDLNPIKLLLDSTMQAENIPAVCIGIVHQGVPYFINRGQLDRDRDKTVDQNSIFQIASLGKPLIGIVANELILQGVISVDQAITDFLQDRFSRRRMRKLEKITIRHLLHHTSGLPQDARAAYRRKDGEAYRYTYTESDFYTDLAKVKIKSTGKYQYSNFGYALLAYMLEIASGMSYNELLQTYVLHPLKMDNTALILNEDQKKRLATPYRKDARDIMTQTWEMGKMAPPSGLYSTTADLSQLLTRQLSAYQTYASEQQPNRWILTHDLVIKRKDARDTYGYGFQAWNNQIYGHGGDMDGYAAFYTLYPEKGYGIILLTSSGEDWIAPLIGQIHRFISDW